MFPPSDATGEATQVPHDEEVDEQNQVRSVKNETANVRESKCFREKKDVSYEKWRMRDEGWRILWITLCKVS